MPSAVDADGILVVMTGESLQALSDEYERAEGRFLAAVRDHADRSALAAAAQQVAAAASAFNAKAYRKFHAQEEDAWMALDQLTERTEVLAEIEWLPGAQCDNAAIGATVRVVSTPGVDNAKPLTVVLRTGTQSATLVLAPI
jgi:hypothetical protein